METATAELHRYAELADKKAALESELKAVDLELKQLQPRALEWFQREGVDRVKLDGRTLYLRREAWAVAANESVTNEQKIDALRAAGLEEMCAPRINSQTLSAWCREREAEGSPLPASFAGIIELRETFKIGSRKS